MEKGPQITVACPLVKSSTRQHFDLCHKVSCTLCIYKKPVILWLIGQPYRPYEKQVSHGMRPFLHVGTAKGNKSTTWKVWEPTNKRAKALRTRLYNISRKMFYKVVAKQTLCNVACYQREITKNLKTAFALGAICCLNNKKTQCRLNFQKKNKKIKKKINKIK
jgi:hypothetical protein